MAAKKYRVGAPIEAWCTKCKLDRESVIETLKSDGNINRVVCRTCEESHLFRRPKGAGGSSGKAKGSSKRRKKGESPISEAEMVDAKPYAIEGEYSSGDVIQHAKFGHGRVVDVRPGGKMEVSFEEGPRLLLCKDVGVLLGGKRRAAPPKPAPKKTGTDEEAGDDGDEDAADENDGDEDDADESAGDEGDGDADAGSDDDDDDDDEDDDDDDDS